MRWIVLCCFVLAAASSSLTAVPLPADFRPVSSPTPGQVDEAREAYARHGAEYACLTDPLNKQRVHIFRMRRETTDADLANLPNLPFRFGLALEYTRVTDAGLRDLGQLDNLDDLGISGTQVTDFGLREIRKFRNLKRLVLSGTKITDAGLEELAGLKQLTCLDLSETAVSNKGVKELKSLPSLTHLDLGCTAVADLEELKTFTKLQSLQLDAPAWSFQRHPAFNPAMTDAALKDIKTLTNLRELSLAYTWVTNAGLKDLQTLEGLADLNLNGLPVTDAGLKDLHALKNLRLLHLKQTSCTRAGMQDLRELNGLIEFDLGSRILRSTSSKLKRKPDANGSS